MFDHFIGFDAAWSELLMEKGCHGREVELAGHFWVLSDAVGCFWILPVESFGISWILLGSRGYGTAAHLILGSQATSSNLGSEA
jgi:hypothetical protein